MEIASTDSKLWINPFTSKSNQNIIFVLKIFSRQWDRWWENKKNINWMILLTLNCQSLNTLQYVTDKVKNWCLKLRSERVWSDGWWFYFIWWWFYFVFSASPITIEMQNLSSCILNLRVCMLLIVKVLLHFRHLIFSKSLKVSFFMSHFLVAV